MIEHIAFVSAIVALLAIGVLSTKRIVVAEREAGSGSPGPSARSERVATLDRYLVAIYAALTIALAAYFMAGLS